MSSISYHGFATYEGRPCVVIKVDGETPVGELEGGPFSWGKGTDQDKADAVRRAAVLAGGKALALALCMEALGGRRDAAERVATRLQWRMVTTLTTGKDFMVRHTDVLDTLRDIASAGAENAKIAEAVDRELAPVASEGGLGIDAATGKPVVVERNGVPVTQIKEEDL